MIFPGCEHLGLKELCRHLEDHGAQGLFALLLDLYPERLTRDACYESGHPFTDAASLFDLGPYLVEPSSSFPPLKVRGGVQHRLYRAADPQALGPVLKKVPLVKWQSGYAFGSSTHNLLPRLRLGKTSGILLHFKLFPGFFQNISEEMKRPDRSLDGIRRHRGLARALSDEPLLSASCSRRYESTFQLTRMGLLHCGADWAERIVAALPNLTASGPSAIKDALRPPADSLADYLQRNLLV